MADLVKHRQIGNAVAVCIRRRQVDTLAERERLDPRRLFGTADRRTVQLSGEVIPLYDEARRNARIRAEVFRQRLHNEIERARHEH